MKKLYLALLALSFVGISAVAQSTDTEIRKWNPPSSEAKGGGIVIPGNSLYTVTFGNDNPNNFGRFSYFPESDALFYDAGSVQSTTPQIPYGLGYRSTDGQYYIMMSETPGSTRNMYTIDPTSGSTTLLGAVVSSMGATNPNTMTIRPDGTCYISYGTGELEIIDLDSGFGTPLGTLPASGGAGLAYDWDNDRLIYAVGTGPVDLYEIDPNTGVSSALFSYSVPGAGGACTAQAMEYVGNNKIIASSTFDCGIIYTVDLVSQATQSLADPNAFDPSIKAMVYSNFSTPFDLACNDATVEVQADLSVPLNGGTVSNAVNNLYAVDLNATAGVDDVHRYNYDPSNDNISVKTPVVTSTGPDGFIAIDFNPVENQTYIIQNVGGTRQLFEFDLDTGTSTYVDDMISPGAASNNAQDFTFGSDGALYVTFQTGEIGLYDLSTGTMNAFADVGAAGAAGGVGLTYDFDNNRLLHASGNPFVTVNGIDIATAVVAVVTNFDADPLNPGCGVTSQGIEYVGGDKVINSSTFGCDSIYTVDLNTGTVTLVRRPNTDDGFDVRIKDLMYIGMDVTLDPSSLDCDDLGANSVDIDVIDYAGNAYSCSVTVTVEDPNDFCGLSVDEFTADQIVMYPNPVSSELQIQWNMAEALQSVEIFDITGKLVMSVDMTRSPSLSLDVSELAGGLYMVKFQSASGSIVKRLLKQ